MKTLEEEIGEMIEFVPPPGEPTEPPVEPGELPAVPEPPAAPEPPLEPLQQVEPPAEPPTPVAPPAGAPPAPTPVAPEPPPVAPAPAADPRDSVIESLRAEIARLTAPQGAPVPAPPSQPQGAPPPAATPQAPSPAPTAPVEFVTSEEEFDRILNSKENFNAFLSQFAEKIRSASVEGSLRALPPVVSNLAEQTVNLRMAIREFYSENKDLIPFKGYVGTVANEMAARNPEMTLDQLVEKLGPEVRTRLALKHDTVAQTPPADGVGGVGPTVPIAGDPNAPAFVPSGGAGRRAPGETQQLNKMQKDILDLIG